MTIDLSIKCCQTGQSDLVRMATSGRSDCPFENFFGEEVSKCWTCLLNSERGHKICFGSFGWCITTQIVLLFSCGFRVGHKTQQKDLDHFWYTRKFSLKVFVGCK